MGAGRSGLTRGEGTTKVYASLLVCLTALAGRDLLAPENGEPRLEIDAVSYAPGDTMRVLLINEASSEVAYGYCFAAMGLERRVEGGWERVHPDIGCIAIYTTVAPGDTVRRDVPVADRLGVPGFYRYDFRVTEPTPPVLVFDPDGCWLGELEVPDGHGVTDLALDRAAAARQDGLEVNYVRVFSLERDGQPSRER